MLDEPLAILAAKEWLDKKMEFSMFKRLHQNIDKHAEKRL